MNTMKLHEWNLLLTIFLVPLAPACVEGFCEDTVQFDETKFNLIEDVGWSAETGNRSCSLYGNEHGELIISCYNISTFPVLSNVTRRKAVTDLLIDRSKLELRDIAHVYPNVSKIRLSNTILKNGIQVGYFQNLTQLHYLIIYLTPLELEYFSHLLCSLTSGRVFLCLKGIFQGLGLVNLTEDLLSCLPKSSIYHFELNYVSIEPASVQTIFCAVGESMVAISLDTIIPNNIPIVLDNEYFHCLENKQRLQHIGIHNTWIKGLTSKTIRYLQHVTYLHLDNSATNINISELGGLSRLKRLYLGQNAYSDFGSICNSIQTFPNLKRLDLRLNYFVYLCKFSHNAYPKLDHLSLRNNMPYIQTIPDGFIKNLKNLKSLNLFGTSIGLLSENAFNSMSLTHLNMNSVLIKIDKVPLNIFSRAKHLTILSMESINKGPPKPTEKKQFDALGEFCAHVFQNLTQLQNLSLKNIGIQTVTKNMLLNSNSLTTLDISENHIHQIAEKAFTHLQHLIKLNLDSNFLSQISSSVLPNITHKLAISISLNPLICDCNLYEFVGWLRNGGKYVFDDKESNLYTCTYGKGGIREKVKEYKPTYRECFTNKLPFTYNLTAYLSLFILMICLLVSVIIKFKWHFYFCYIMTRARTKQYQQLKDNKDYMYDAFVSYNRLDTTWVVKVLRPMLEDQHGLRLCLHDRDWLGGLDIVDNIYDSIDNSRKVVLIITNAFAASNWCQLELTMAQHRLFSEDRNNLVLVVKEEVVDELMTPRLALEMRERTYIRWEEGGMGERVFWKRLVEAVKCPVASFRQALQT